GSTAMPGNLQQVDDATESCFAREAGRDVRPLDRLDGIDFDEPYTRAVVAVTDFHARAVPDAHAAGDVAALDAWTQALGEIHVGMVCLFSKRLYPLAPQDDNVTANFDG